MIDKNKIVEVFYYNLILMPYKIAGFGLKQDKKTLLKMLKID